eukprot:scaffold31545_cov69-Phaeocystis_antarctica.AAC.3
MVGILLGAAAAEHVFAVANQPEWKTGHSAAQLKAHGRSALFTGRSRHSSLSRALACASSQGSSPRLTATASPVWGRPAPCAAHASRSCACIDCQSSSTAASAIPCERLHRWSSATEALRRRSRVMCAIAAAARAAAMLSFPLAALEALATLAAASWTATLCEAASSKTRCRPRHRADAASAVRPASDSRSSGAGRTIAANTGNIERGKSPNLVSRTARVSAACATPSPTKPSAETTSPQAARASPSHIADSSTSARRPLTPTSGHAR